MEKQKPMSHHGLYDTGNNPCMQWDHDLKGITEMVAVKGNCYGSCDRIGIPLPNNILDIGILISLVEKHKRKSDIKKILVRDAKSICRNCRGLHISGSIDGPLCIDFPETESFKLAVEMLVVYGSSPDEPSVDIVSIKENDNKLIDIIIPALEEFSEGLFTEDGITTIDNNTCEFIIDEIVHEDLAGKKMRVTVELVTKDFYARN